MTFLNSKSVPVYTAPNPGNRTTELEFSIRNSESDYRTRNRYTELKIGIPISIRYRTRNRNGEHEIGLRNTKSVYTTENRYTQLKIGIHN
jgi:hypothetical protein